MTTIIYAHPLEDSLNSSIRDALVQHLHASGQPCNMIDLYKDGFEPAMTPDERKTFFTGTGVSGDALVKRYQDMLRETSHLVFIFPVWNSAEPSIVKAFFERTCLPGFGFAYAEVGIQPLLTNIQRLSVLTTSGASTEMLVSYFGNCIEKQFVNSLVCGIIGPVESKDYTWMNLGEALDLSEKTVSAHIDRVIERFRGNSQQLL